MPWPRCGWVFQVCWLLLGAVAAEAELAWPICFANATCIDGSADSQAQGPRYLFDIDVEGPRGGSPSTVFLRRPHFDPIVRISFVTVLLEALLENESLSVDISVCAIQGTPVPRSRACWQRAMRRRRESLHVALFMSAPHGMPHVASWCVGRRTLQ
jgi:hypothetical protein